MCTCGENMQACSMSMLCVLVIERFLCVFYVDGNVLFASTTISMLCMSMMSCIVSIFHVFCI